MIGLWLRLPLSLDSAVGTVTRSGGHALGSLSHAGPLHHSCFSSVTGSLRLATSAGLSLVAMYLHVMSPCSLIFRTRFATNCLKSPFPRIQCSATLLSSQLLIPIIPMFDNSRFPVNISGSMFDFTRTQTWFFNVLFIMLQNHLILHLILLTQPEVTQCYEIVTHYPFRLYNISPSRITIIALMLKFLL